MPLMSQLFPLPFQTGVNEKSDSRWVDVGAQTSLQNGHLAQTGSIRKRNGYGVIGGSGSYTQRSKLGNTLGADTFQRIFAYQDGHAQVNGGRLWALAPSVKTLFDLDAVSPIVARRYPCDATSKAITSQDIAIAPSGLIVSAYCSNSVLYASVFDPVSRSVVQTVASPTAADYVRAVTVAGSPNVFLITQTTATPANLLMQTLDTTALVINPGTTYGACSGAARWDACTIEGDTAPGHFVLVYSAGGTWVIDLIDQGGAISSTATFTPAGTSPTVQNIAVRATHNENIWVAHCDVINGGLSPTLIRVMDLDASTLGILGAGDTQLDSISGAAAARLGVERVDATHAAVAWSTRPQYGMVTKWNTVTATSGTLGQVRELQQCGLYSVPFMQGGKLYAQLLFSSSQTPPYSTTTTSGLVTQPAPTAYLVDLLAADTSTVNQTGQLRGVVAPRVVSGNDTTIGAIHVPHVVTSGLSAYTVLPTIRSGTDPNGLDFVRYERSYAAHQTARLGDCVYMSGGVPCVYDGKRVTELGFAYNVADAGNLIQGAGGSIADNSYIYAFVWEWRDATGQRKQSQPVYSPITVSAGGGTASVALTIPCLSLTLCQDSDSSWLPNVSLAIYRTIPSLAAGIFCRVYSGDVPTSVLSTPYGASNVTYTDTASDASIEANEQLYTQGSVVSSQIPSSFTCLIAHQGRLIGVGDDEQTIWYSTQWDGGTTQPRFNDSFYLTVPDGGRITAIASLDDQLIIFKKKQIYVISGYGPDEAGAGPTWSTPRLVPSDVGCDSDWRGVCVTPLGVVFQHGSRLYLLSRGLDVQYFSRPVETTLAAYPVVTSMTLVPEYQQFRVTCRTAEGSSSGRILVYDYVSNAWSVYNTYDSDAAVQGFGCDSACYTSQGYVWLGGSGSPWFELSGTYLDPGSTWVTLVVESAWMKPAGILGFGRFRWAILAAERNTDADLIMSVATEYSDTYAQTGLITADQVDNGFYTPKAEAKLHIVNQKASAIRVKISDQTPTGGTIGTGQGYNLFGLIIEGGIKKGYRKLPGTQGV